MNSIAAYVDELDHVDVLQERPGPPLGKVVTAMAGPTVFSPCFMVLQ